MINTDYKFDEVHNLVNQIENGAERVNFKNIFNNSNGGVALVAFKAGQKLDPHIAPAELLVTVLEGEIEFTTSKPHLLKEGDFLLVGEGVMHHVVANADSKMLLVKIKP